MFGVPEIYLVFILYILVNILVSMSPVVAMVRNVLSGMGLGALTSGYPLSCVLQFVILFVTLLLAGLSNTGGFSGRKRHKKTLRSSLAVGGFMLVYLIYTFAYQFLYAMQENYPLNGKGTILYSSLYFLLIAMTEEELFRGFIADKLFAGTFRPSGSREEFGTEAAIPGVQYYTAVPDKEASGKAHRLKKGYVPLEKRQTESPEMKTYAGHVWAGVIFSAILFALSHALNFRSGYMYGVVMQICGAFVMGFYLAAVYYRTRNIFTVIFLHFFNDIAAGMTTTIFRMDGDLLDIVEGYGPENVIVLLPFLFAGIYLLRRRKIEESRKLWDPKRDEGQAMYDGLFGR